MIRRVAHYANFYGQPMDDGCNIDAFLPARRLARLVRRCVR